MSEAARAIWFWMQTFSSQRWSACLQSETNCPRWNIFFRTKTRHISSFNARSVVLPAQTRIISCISSCKVPILRTQEKRAAIHSVVALNRLVTTVHFSYITITIITRRKDCKLITQVLKQTSLVWAHTFWVRFRPQDFSTNTTCVIRGERYMSIFA